MVYFSDKPDWFSADKVVVSINEEQLEEFYEQRNQEPAKNHS